MCMCLQSTSGKCFFLKQFLFKTFRKEIIEIIESDNYLYTDDTFIFYRDKDDHKIEDVLNKEFSTLWERFVDNKLLIHFRKNKKKIIFQNVRQS